MGLTASLWSSVSGLLTHGDKMNVVGNNIANVSTIGFKAQRMDFNDYLYISGGSTSGPTQIGAGTGVYAVLGDFSQGTFQSTNSVTDIAIDGEGWFKLRKTNANDQMFYSRAGDFYFNKDRELQNPEGLILQGWRVNNESRLSFKKGAVNLGGIEATRDSAFVGVGSPKDIVLDSWYLQAKQTSHIGFTMGLLSNDPNSDKSTSNTQPLTALFDTWDAKNEPPMASTAYATSSTIKVYDEGGVGHDVTVYYDQVARELSDEAGNVIYQLEGYPAGYTMYEYIVTIPPEEDMRSYGGRGFNDVTNEWEAREPTKLYKDPVAGTNKNAGVLMVGHLIFDAGGNIVNQTAYTWGGNEVPGAGNQFGEFSGADWDPVANPDADQPDNPKRWQQTKFSSNGLPVCLANFTGQPLANSVNETLNNANNTSQAENYIIELDFGLRNTGNWDGAFTDLAQLNVQPADVPAGHPYPFINYNDLAKFDSVVREEYGSTAGNASYVVQESNQNGYQSGILSNVNIERNGVVYGNYDNGENIPLYQIALYDFHNEQGLYREGGNLYSKTKKSGEPRQGVPGFSGFGETAAYYIEQSNVDMSREFVEMISTQRGFQANSKGVTTVDTMLETVINMKR